MVSESHQWTVGFYRNARGKSPAKEFVDGLPARERAKVYNYLRLLREFGINLRMPYAEPLSGHSPLWELRPGAIRLIYFAHTGRMFVILHAFRKKSRKIPSQEIVVAERRMFEFLEGRQ